MARGTGHRGDARSATRAVGRCSRRSSAATTVRGVISLQNIDREHAFSEADVRLLDTLAGSLSVALENARLFDETKRLLTETDERAAELAIINSVQQGLAARTSTCRRCTTSSATRSARSSTRRSSTSASSTSTRTSCATPTRSSAGCASPTSRRRSQLADVAGHHRRAASRCSFDVEAWYDESGRPIVLDPGRAAAVRRSLRRSSSAMRSRAASRSRTSTASDAFNEADLRLLTTLAASLSVALESARLFDETKRLLTETTPRRRARDREQRAARPRRRARHAGDVRAGRGAGAARSSTPRSSTSRIYDPASGMMTFPLRVERGVALPDREPCR